MTEQLPKEKRFADVILVVTLKRSNLEVSRKKIRVQVTPKRYISIGMWGREMYDRASGQYIGGDRHQSMYRYRLEPCNE